LAKGNVELIEHHLEIDLNQFRKIWAAFMSASENFQADRTGVS